MSSIYWFMILFLIVAILVTVFYIYVVRTSEDCCYKDDVYATCVLTPAPASSSTTGGCCANTNVKKCDNNRDFYAMVICLGVILAIMITVFILFIYLSPREKKTQVPSAVVATASKAEIAVLPTPQFKPELVVLPPPMKSTTSEDYVRLGSLGCKKRSCRKAPKFKAVVV